MWMMFSFPSKKVDTFTRNLAMSCAFYDFGVVYDDFNHEKMMGHFVYVIIFRFYNVVSFDFKKLGGSKHLLMWTTPNPNPFDNEERKKLQFLVDMVDGLTA